MGFRDGWTVPHGTMPDDPDHPLLPKGLDSARYRALGNAVVPAVAEWIAVRIKEELDGQ
jgi:DNA (cytosine-5)-methyltransferase 1